MIRLVVAGRRDELAEISGATSSGEWQRSAPGVTGRWPMMRNDGQRLWTCATDVTRRGATTRLSIYDIQHDDIQRGTERGGAGGSEAELAYEAEFPGGIAPRVPVYVNPSPVDDTAALVAPGESGLRLELVRRVPVSGDDEQPAWERRDCGPGGPIFPAWAPDGRTLSVHRGIVLEQLDQSGELQDRLEGATAFRTPAWSPDGERIAFATVRDETAVELRVSPVSNLSAGQPLAEFGAALVLGWQPGSEWLSIATSGDAAASSFTSLVAVHAESGTQRRLFGGPFVGFWWAPDGSRVVVMTPTQTGDGSFRLVALAPEGLVIGAADAIVPSEDTRLAAAFFDQYSASHSPWLPDSSAFIVSGRLPGSGRPASFGDVAHNHVYLWEARRGAPLFDAGPGDFATAVL